MSYAALPLIAVAGFADIDAWTSNLLPHAMSPTEVYVLRFRARGAKLSRASDALLFVRAAGQGQNLSMDVRGVAVSHDSNDPDDTNTVDVVFTVAPAGTIIPGSVTIPGVSDDANSMAAQIAADADLRAAFPNIGLDNAQFGQLTAPVDAIDHWRSQPVLWDHTFHGAKNRGGPTDSFAQPAEYSIVQGRADDGARAKPWRVSKMPLGDKLSVPGLPDWAPYAGVAVVLGGIGWWVMRGRRRTGRA